MSAFGGRADMTLCAAHVAFDRKRTLAGLFPSTGTGCYHCGSDPRGRNNRRRESIGVVACGAADVAVFAHAHSKLKKFTE